MTTETTTAERAFVEPKRRPYWIQVVIRIIKEKPLGTFGLIVVVLLILAGVFADFLAPYPMNKINLADTLSPPSLTHWLGTDNLGRDVFSNIIYGARVSMIIGFTATFASMVVSIIIGALSAQIGGLFDMIMQRFVDAWMCIPGLMILLIMMSILGKGMPQMIAAMAIPGGIGGSRMIRSAVLAVKAYPYVEAERAIGCGLFPLLYRHVLPNIAPLIILAAAMQVGGMIMMESGLSFLGYGVPPGVPSWGSMLSQEGRQYMEIAPALAFWPGFVLSIVIFGSNMFGDALRDILDPRLKGGVGSYTGPDAKKLKKMKAKTSM